ncbi:sugar ABC transporter ATP-binding protein [Caldanaerobacter subterraneus]|uniref:ABC-type sugar (Aldose) transport system, ATPase component n=1 Tax=Caldanaerobacter subterraneus subsp. pacificus DSM 12653 TaxID=391606 RepID=B7R619_9THEO|nr:sugar ABC transporter ATP-binding protein [Caldanaerobacter subterraneus]KKC30738.1 ABC-type sugar (aldose) transport system, ATPase component [Caldanaerobacter subterraneus subsp. pacificus DSM 12653]
MGEPVIELRQITKNFGGVKALRGVDLTLYRGEVCCLIGENGSGKSTLIKIISGIHEPDSGEIIIDGFNYKRLYPLDSLKKGIEVIYQDFSLFPNLTVAENLAINELLLSNNLLVKWKDVFEIANKALDNINIYIDPKRLANDLSVAERQLVAIARAVLRNTRLIIMDEPTTALTQKEIDRLMKVISTLKNKGTSILFVSHKLDEVLQIADRIVILRNGEKVFDGKAESIDRATIVRYMIGRELSHQLSLHKEEKKDVQVVLKVEHLTRKGNFYDISFELKRGEILGITGLLGSGRTALALSLFGALPPDSGTIYVEGKQVTLNSIQDAIKHGIGYLPEDRVGEGLFISQSIGKNIVVRVINYMVKKIGLIDQFRVNDTIQTWLKQLKIVTPSANLPVSSLSGGNQQRVVLAKWLASNPKILILNGPTVGVDVGSKMEIHKLIRDLAAQGMAFIVISDDIPELLEISHRILLMKKGRIVGEFLREMLTESKLNAMLTAI